MSKKEPSGKIIFSSVLFTCIALFLFGENLPYEFAQDISKMKEELYNRLDDPSREAVDRIRTEYGETKLSTENRIEQDAKAKLEELEKQEVAQGENTVVLPSNSKGQVQENKYFPSYNFSDDTLYLMVKLAAAEQGNTNIKGMAVEMCTMLDIAESWEINTEEGFRKFISSNPGNGGWFESAPSIAESESGHPDNPIPRDSDMAKEMMEIAKRIAKGERYIPKNIVEHVSYSSIDYIILDGVRYDKSEKDKYIKGRTIIVQVPRIGGQFTFYGFLAGTTDPFGYYNEPEVEAYFDFDTGELIVDGKVLLEQVQNKPNSEPSNTSQTENSIAQDNIETKQVSLTNEEYANESIIHSDSATLYINNRPNKKNITVCVNAGHGTSGGENVQTYCHPDHTPKVTGGSTAEGATKATAVASGMTFLNGTEEREVTLRQALILRDELLNEGYNVLMIRETEDIQLDNIARTVLANTYANCHIALHWDDTDYDKGVYYMKVPDIDSYKNMEPVVYTWEKSDKLGETIIEEFKDKGIRVFEDGSIEMDLTQTSYSKVPSIDIELGDRASDTSDENLEKNAEAILAGLTKYYDLEKDNAFTIKDIDGR